MVACTAKPISIGLQPSGKSWRHQRPRSPVNRARKRGDGRLYVRRLPECSRWPANATHHPEMLTACSATIQNVERLPRLGHLVAPRAGLFDPNVFTSIACKFLLLVSGV